MFMAWAPEPPEWWLRKEAPASDTHSDWARHTFEYMDQCRHDLVWRKVGKSPTTSLMKTTIRQSSALLQVFFSNESWPGVEHPPKIYKNMVQSLVAGDMNLQMTLMPFPPLACLSKLLILRCPNQAELRYHIKMQVAVSLSISRLTL